MGFVGLAALLALATGAIIGWKEGVHLGQQPAPMEVLDRYHFVLDYIVICTVIAAQFENHFWRLFMAALSYYGFTRWMPLVVAEASLSLLFVPVLLVAIWKVPLMRPRQGRKGSWVFVTGCDSGMGKETAAYLATRGYDGIFAGCYNLEAATKALRESCADGTAFTKIVPVPLDVTSEDSVKEAAKTVAAHLDAVKGALTGVINFHGVAYNGPVEYMPIEFYQRQMDVNFLGNIRMTQAFLPLLKQGVAKLAKNGETRRARLIFTGTGGGACSPCPALLSAYMSSKFAVEAYCQSLRMEMFMRGYAIDCCVINPGFVKPTMLIEIGQKLAQDMWARCKAKLGSDIAQVEYGPLFDHFNKYSALQPGTHVSFVAKAADDALTAYRPWTSYKVGPDSKAAPIVGMFPTGMREWIARNGMFGVLSPAGTVKGYVV